MAFIYLFWESGIIKKQVVPTAYFYTKIKEPVVAPMDFDPENFKLDALMENDFAFIDSDTYIMKYVPKNFLNN